jgi:hypothetical protein
MAWGGMASVIVVHTGGTDWYRKAKPGESGVQPRADHGEARSYKRRLETRITHSTQRI